MYLTKISTQALILKSRCSQLDLCDDSFDGRFGLDTTLNPKLGARHDLKIGSSYPCGFPTITINPASNLPPKRLQNDKAEALRCNILLRVQDAIYPASLII